MLERPCSNMWYSPVNYDLNIDKIHPSLAEKISPWKCECDGNFAACPKQEGNHNCGLFAVAFASEVLQRFESEA